MFDIGWTELLLIGIVALIVVGPKDLPGMFRTLGRFIGKARAMAREFQRAMEQAADESGVKDMAREFKDAASGKDFGTDELRSFAKGPKAWAKEAAKKSVLKDPEGTAPPAGPAGTAAGTPTGTHSADAPEIVETPAAPRPTGPVSSALAAARSAGQPAPDADAAATGTVANPAPGPSPADPAGSAQPGDRA
jgi:sec-independent protein translocase protein TatB